jgi:predicted RNase H-like HicB family nuclease
MPVKGISLTRQPLAESRRQYILLENQETWYDCLRNHKGGLMKQFKIIVEKHSDGYVAYPLGIKGVVVGQGDTYEEALSDVKSAIRFHIETFGLEGFV